jgi:hypothetical protein
MRKKFWDKGTRYAPSLPTVEEEIPTPATTTSNEHEHVLSASPNRMNIEFNFPDSQILSEEIPALSSSLHPDEEQNWWDSSTLPPGTPPPALIIEHDLSNVPAPPVHDYNYYCKICNVHIYIPCWQQTTWPNISTPRPKTGLVLLVESSILMEGGDMVCL